MAAQLSESALPPTGERRPWTALALGPGRLIEEAERLVTGGFESGADRLMMAVSDSEGRFDRMHAELATVTRR